MKSRTVISLGLSAMVLGGTMVGCAAGKGGIASASTRSMDRAEKQAQNEASDARKAFGKHKYADAIAHAEAAVGFQPQVAAYRVLLGQSYLQAGRFDSAKQAFSDATSLDPADGMAALHLALAQTATGDWDGALKTLDAGKTIIPVSDRGLAMALAGDPVGAVEVLGNAARSPDADAKTRQNYALSLALAGRWQEAKTVAAVDLSPADVDKRIIEWASFSKPTSASDQVAALLGVTPVVDPGQPVSLALNAQTSTVAMASSDPIDAYMPSAPDGAEAVAADMGTPVEQPELQMASMDSNVRFGPRQEVVQPLPVSVVRAVARSTPMMAKSDPVMAVSAITPTSLSKGDFYVQLGAFKNPGVAKVAWARATSRYAGLSNHNPSGMPIKTKAGTFYRLSVGGFGRADADALCGAYKSNGGKCFVRSGAGDKIAMWAKGTQLASR